MISDQVEYSSEYSNRLFDPLFQVAWLFNLRGSDIPYNPVFMSYAIVIPGRLAVQSSWFGHPVQPRVYVVRHCYHRQRVTLHQQHTPAEQEHTRSPAPGRRGR